MQDIQSLEDSRRINIKKVGVKTVSYPVTLRDKEKSRQQTVATVNMYVNLPHQFKGTHMSRFVEILNQYHGTIDLGNFQDILEEMKTRLQAEASHMEMAFPFFLDAKNVPAPLRIHHYQCVMRGSLEEAFDLEFQVTLPIYAAINGESTAEFSRSMGQWGQAVVRLRFFVFMWIEDVILAIEERIAAEVVAARARQQESLSVEMLTQGIGQCLEAKEEIRSYAVRVENFCDGSTPFAFLESEAVS